jgi:hypothetical protein
VDARLFSLSHEEILREAAVALPPDMRPGLRALLARPSGVSYDQLVHDYFAVTGPDDPRYDDHLIGAVALNRRPDLSLLWEALFTRNEKQYGRAYPAYQRRLLKALSHNFHPQHVLVTGHIDCPGGYTLVNKQQLRLASGKHAHPPESAQYLLLDAGKPIFHAGDLLSALNK